jgi:hypothetical protein
LVPFWGRSSACVPSPHADTLPPVLAQATQKEIIKATEALWRAKCSSPELAAYLNRKKEKGHGLADWVEEQTVEMLEAHFGPRATHQLDPKTKDGERRARSMGDIWIESGGIFNPVNIKTGVKKPGRSTGQPNLVSLRKLTEAVYRHWIDSYYLLFVHFVADDPPTSQVALADLLHIVQDYAHFDSGTGQLMLKAGKFDDPPEPIYVVVDRQTAIDRLLLIRKEGDRSLMENRAATLAETIEKVEDFDPDAEIDQEGLGLDTSR